MKILITGAKGFVGKNLMVTLKTKGYTEIYQYDLENKEEDLHAYTKDCAFVFHLAGVNRPQDQKDYYEGNVGFTQTLLDSLKKNKNTAPILMTSSIQATLDNPYGKSKGIGEKMMLEYAKKNDSQTYLYRLPNIFGKWCRPHYNSVVATFCENIANDQAITIHDSEAMVSLVYIDDVIKSFIEKLEEKKEHSTEKFESVHPIHCIKLGQLAEVIQSFKKSREILSIPKMEDPFIKKLYSTYLTYLPKDQFSYPLKENKDHRGSFTEIIRTKGFGQFSVNISNPGILKGEHWHQTKNEKFLVVSGEGIIRFRKIGTKEVIHYLVSEKKKAVLDIPPGYTHNIENTGEKEMITFMWANEPYEKDTPDTYIEDV